MKHIAIYYRVSTDLQDFESQKHAVEQWLKNQQFETATVYTDVGSGKLNERPQFQTMLTRAKGGEHDTIVVFKLDRLTRSAIYAIRTIIDLWEAGVMFISITQPILSMGEDNPFKNTILAIFSDIAQLEREQIVARTKAGIAAYRKKSGGKWGQSFNSKISDEKRAQAIQMRLDGASWGKIGKFLRVTRPHAYRLFKKYYVQKETNDATAN